MKHCEVIAVVLLGFALYERYRADNAEAQLEAAVEKLMRRDGEGLIEPSNDPLLVGSYGASKSGV